VKRKEKGAEVYVVEKIKVATKVSSKNEPELSWKTLRERGRARYTEEWASGMGKRGEFIHDVGEEQVLKKSILTEGAT